MALKTFVKISNVTNLSDARYCAGMGVDMIGFSLDPDNPSYISPEKSVEIAEWLAGVDFVGEFHSDDIARLKETVQAYPVNYLEYSRPELTNAISALGYSSIFKTKLPEKHNESSFLETLMFCHDKVDYIFIDEIPEFGENTLPKLKVYCEKFPVILGGEFTKDNVLPVLEEIPARGIALKGSEEIKPGFKDFDELADILELLEVDDLEE